MRSLFPALVVLLSGCAGTVGGHLFTGQDWRASDINGVPVIGERPLTLRLEKGERASGHGGCNSFSGGYQRMSKEGIRFTALSTTRVACAPEIMDQERRYLSILESVQGYSFYSDGGLSLIAPDGRAIRFRR
jgi:heat shock protein HslJ